MCHCRVKLGICHHLNEDSMTNSDKQPAAFPPCSCFVFRLLQSFIVCRCNYTKIAKRKRKKTSGEIWGFELTKAEEEHKLSCIAGLKETSLIDNLLLLSVSDGVLSRVLLCCACFLCWPGTDNKNPSL